MSFGQSDPTVRSVNGHDVAYATTNRPTSMTVGEIGFNTATGRVEVANGSTLNNITDVAASTFAGTVGNPNSLNAGDGAPGSGATAGAAGGTATVKGGAGGAKINTGHAAGGTGAAASVTGGAGGNTASNGTDAGGAGADATVTGGAGGNATAGTGNGGAGGNVVLTPGSGGTSAGGSAGAIGSVKIAGPLSSVVTAAQTIANTITMAASGTSHVADGTSCVIPVTGKLTFVWSATQSLWYH